MYAASFDNLDTGDLFSNVTGTADNGDASVNAVGGNITDRWLDAGCPNDFKAPGELPGDASLNAMADAVNKWIDGQCQNDFKAAALADLVFGQLGLR
jgi:hypothetical protein